MSAAKNPIPLMIKIPLWESASHRKNRMLLAELRRRYELEEIPQQAFSRGQTMTSMAPTRGTICLGRT